MDAGTRTVSIRKLAQASQVLGCSPGDLLEVSWGQDAAVFGELAIRQRLQARDIGTPDGSEKGWTHAVLLAWQRHYRARRPA